MYLFYQKSNFLDYEHEVEAKLTTTTEQKEKVEKKEFKEWFKDMRDPTHTCKFNSSQKERKLDEENKKKENLFRRTVYIYN